MVPALIKLNVFFHCQSVNLTNFSAVWFLFSSLKSKCFKNSWIFQLENKTKLLVLKIFAGVHLQDQWQDLSFHQPLKCHCIRWPAIFFNRHSERTICVDSAAVTVQMSTSEWADSTAAGVISTSSMKHTKETSLGNNEGELADAAASKRKETTKDDQK